jgi:hypothetical protein
MSTATVFVLLIAAATTEGEVLAGSSGPYTTQARCEANGRAWAAQAEAKLRDHGWTCAPLSVTPEVAERVRAQEAARQQPQRPAAGGGLVL